MKILIGADYRGFQTKETLRNFLKTKGSFKGETIEITDVGALAYNEGDDFNEPAIKVAMAIQKSPESFGILICDSAHGVTIQANRFLGVRAAHCENAESAKLAREHDDANVLCLSAHFLTPEKLEEIVEAFLETDFVPLDRRLNRIRKLDDLSAEALGSLDYETNVSLKGEL